MQNKGFIKFLASLNSTPFYLGSYTLKQCRETAIGLGLDLKGGMNVILEVSVPEVVKTLADHKTDEAFTKAVASAAKESQESQSDFITLFVKAFKENSKGQPLATIFATQQLKGKVNTNSTDAEVESVLRESVDEAVNNSFNVLRTRIDRFGVVQPNIQKIEGASGRIMVELPGIKEPERVRKLLQGSANLEFWETYDTQVIIPYLNQLNSALRNGAETMAAADTTATEEVAATDSTAATKEVAQADSSKAGSLLSQVSSDELSRKAGKAQKQATEEAKKENPLFAMLQPVQGNAGCMVGYALASDTAEINRLLTGATAKNIFPNDLSLKWGVKSMDKAGKVFELYAIRTTGTNGRAPLEGEVVTEAKDEFDQYGNPCVSMKMNTEGARKWSSLTEANVGHAIAIVLDNLVYSAPNVNGKIDGGSSQITGNFTTNDTKDLANVLQSGKMPAPAQIVQEDIVGPTLGQQSIEAGFISCIVAFIVLMLYMVLMYGIREGMVANCALILNFFFSFGILTSLGAALTMSGIAGMVLTLGMAVDANVLIYERTKEEMRAGKNIKNAVDAGYSNAFSAIFDSNVTTILTGSILYNFGTGPIKGFATTLMIGIICSFFTAVWLTRIVYEHFVNNGKWQDLKFNTAFSLNNWMKDTKYNFMGKYKKSFTVFGVLAAVAIVSFFVRGLSQSIDFTGGRNYKVEFLNPVQTEDVKAAIVKQFEANNPEGEAINVTVIALGTGGNNVRVSTNYLIKENNAESDALIESMLYRAFVDGGMVDANVSEADFLDRFVYILIRFRNVAYSVGSIVALVVDTLLVIGAFSLCYGWMPFSLEIDQTFIGAILTVIGYSINDKVVVFDRIRETFQRHPRRERQEIFNDSLNACLARTINTSVSTLIVLLVIFFLGGDSIRPFSFAMILGVVIGTLSSLFVAAPTAYLVMGARIKEEGEPEVAVEPAK